MKQKLVLLLMLLFVAGCHYTSDAQTSSVNYNSSAAESSNHTEYKIDENVLYHLELTYGQIIEKHGDYSNKIYFEGNYFYYFDNANCAYYFGTDGDASPLGNSQCTGVYINAQYLFLNMGEEISIDDLSLRYSLALLGEPEKSIEYDDTYYSFFSYGKYKMWIQSSSPKMIGRNSLVYIEEANGTSSP